MRITEDIIDRLDRTNLIAILELSRKAVVNYQKQNESAKMLNAEITSLENKLNRATKGFKGTIIVLFSVIVTFVFTALTKNLTTGMGWGILSLLVFFILNKTYFPKKRLAHAQSEYDKKAPDLKNNLDLVNQKMRLLENSDELHNLFMLLPNEYANLESIDSLIDILKTRRARHIPDAINVLDERRHMKRMEEIAKEELKATKETAEAQKRAAKAAEESARQAKEAVWQQAQNQKAILQQKPSTTEKAPKNKYRCPRCREWIQKGSWMCPFCHANFEDAGVFDTLFGRGYKGSAFK